MMTPIKAVLVSATGGFLLMMGLVATADDLYQKFATPQPSTAPHVWWHWRNGAINEQEAINDLEWLHKTGIGGVQLFEAGMGTPAPAHKRVIYGSKAWQNVLSSTTDKAHALGLDFAITTSPGWSATGGPWVKLEDAMKKLVWSKVRVTGGKRLQVSVPRPPSVAGPYQDIPLAGLGEHAHSVADFYRDIAVLAIPVNNQDLAPLQMTTSAQVENIESLQDKAFWPAQSLPSDEQGNAWLQLSAVEPITVQGVTLGLPDPRGFGTGQPPTAKFQYSHDGKIFKTVSEMQPTRSLVRSASFTPVTAKYFRVLLTPSDKPGFMASLHYATGAKKLPMPVKLEQYAISEVKLHTSPRVNALEEKAGFAAAEDYYAVATEDGVKAGASLNQVKDVTAFMDVDGRLNWEAPAGQWKIIRLGYSLTGHHNGPAPEEATGLEVDKLSAEKVAAYLEQYARHYYSNGQLQQGITGLLSDSIESGPQNWTDNFIEDFQRLHGYDPLLWLVSLTGEVIESAAATDRFLWDFRQTIAELLQENHYQVIADFARKHGLTYYAEALEDHRPQLGNDLDMRSVADVPMGAFWFYPEGTQPKATYLMDVKGAASVANVYGKPIVATEAMTTFGYPWAVGPKELKVAADQAMILGANRLMLHSSVHQAEGKTYTPGMSLMPLLGHYFNRNMAWADQAKGWVDYLTRAQTLLQQGHRVTDFAYFIGEEAPVTALFGDKTPNIPTGYDYDFISAKGLSQLKVKDSVLFNRSGGSYRFLYLGGSSRFMTLSTLQKLLAIARQGVVITGAKPMASPSLADDPQKVQQAIQQLWALPNVHESLSASQAISQLGISPQWHFDVNSSGAAAPQRASLWGQAREIDDRTIMFLVNSLNQPLTGQLTLAKKGVNPELWYPMSGVRSTPDWVSTDEEVKVSLNLAPHESVFLVLNEAQKPSLQVDSDISVVQKTIPLISDWQFSTDAHYGPEISLTLNKLKSLSRFDDERLKYFSGVTHYHNQFMLTQNDVNKSQQLLLEIANIGDIADVSINGHSAGTLWTWPYTLNVTDFVRAGQNQLSITISNLWSNRLIGVAVDTEKGIPHHNMPLVYSPDAPLRPSGLIGPVNIVVKHSGSL
ncbi:glycoside hydrolase [Aestuariicella hydrocarbonica]|uniref:Glycoside hydrolase n=1 Tax=Pseudomaricurvus hydrocarbonicus TaxID=1470433 RepID=A0A9E5MNA6_9GAMM|nr:glycosyl hydrolase [Aestuariicella hydrocarbonica]NHO67386.1 glycoside hydrolase [Aestuariicella hydrocarbonica]